MTPIQTHKAELRTLMERAGLTVDPSASSAQIDSADKCGIMSLYSWHGSWMHRCAYREHSGTPICDASHPDPRVALRHCLEMAGLLAGAP
jgi:hypothetical protein